MRRGPGKVKWIRPETGGTEKYLQYKMRFAPTACAENTVGLFTGAQKVTERKTEISIQQWQKLQARGLRAKKYI